MLGEKAKAAFHLRQALDLALPDALYLPFAESHGLIGPLLKDALSGKEREEALPRMEALAKRLQAGRASVLREVLAVSRFREFSGKELAVAQLVGKGLSNNEIAEKLHIKVRTVKDRLSRIFQKSGLKQRDELRKLLAAR
jgi:LuxR family maltose regulon positive regulatory protein